MIKKVVPSLDEQITDVYKTVKDGIELLHRDHIQIMKDLEELKEKVEKLQK